MLANWYEAGYMNEDYVSCKKDDICKALANNEGAFTLYSTEMIPSVLAYNENANIGILPAPAKDENAASYFGTGEGNFSCFGIWKDTEYADECKQFLEYLARPEVAVKIVQIDGGIPALTTIELDETDKAAYTTNAFGTPRLSLMKILRMITFSTVNISERNVERNGRFCKYTSC